MGNLQDRLDAQERLIRALLEYFGPNGERTEGTDDSEDAYKEENGTDDEPEDDSEDETDPKTT
jgi:hypothetical protein